MKKFLLIMFIIFSAALFITGCETYAKEIDTKESDVDIDLSELSLSIIQTEYSQIVSNATDYSGKTIRAYGSYYTLFFDDTGKHSHYIIVVPGDECCRLGFEFRRDGDYVFPQDYPSENAIILITGTLHRDADSGLSSIYIDVDELSVISG